MSRISQAFRGFAEGTARRSGRPGAFLLAALVVIVWAGTGPLFHFGDTWQLVINTGTTIITFLMVFLIQNSQNRDSAALQIKLDELIRATSSNDGLLAVEDLDDDALDRVREHYRAIALRRAQAQKDGVSAAQAGATEGSDDGCEEVKAIERELDGAHAAAVQMAEIAAAEPNSGASNVKTATITTTTVRTKTARTKTAKTEAAHGKDKNAQNS